MSRRRQTRAEAMRKHYAKHRQAILASRKAPLVTADRGDEVHAMACDADDRLRANLGAGCNWRQRHMGAL